MQNYRAIMSLTALMGTFGAPGGNIPVSFSYIHTSAGFITKEHEFEYETAPHKGGCIGEGRFPLWAELIGEAQANDMARRPYTFGPCKRYGASGPAAPGGI